MENNRDLHAIEGLFYAPASPRPYQYCQAVVRWPFIHQKYTVLLDSESYYKPETVARRS